MPRIQDIMGRRIRAQRGLLGMTQITLAQTVDMPQEHISRYERGLFIAMNPSRLAALADALHCSADYLLGRSPTPHHAVSACHGPPTD